MTDEAAHACTPGWRGKEEHSAGGKAGAQHLCVPAMASKEVKSHFHQNWVTPALNR